jgi:hypothetical protein
LPVSPDVLAYSKNRKPAPTLDFPLITDNSSWLIGVVPCFGSRRSGNTSGYAAQVAYDLARNYGVIVLRSAGGGEADAGRLALRAFSKLRAGIPKK